MTTNVKKELLERLRAGKLQPVSGAPVEEDKAATAAIDQRLNEAPKDDKPPSGKPELPPFAKWVEEGNAIRITGNSIDDPGVKALYTHLSKGLSARIPLVAVFLAQDASTSDHADVVNRERNDAFLQMTTGWFAPTFVHTPLLYVLLQGPHEGPRNELEKNASQSPAYAATTHLMRYYRALQLILFDAYASESETDASIKTRMLRAISDKQFLGERLTRRMQETLHAALKAVFATQQPKPFRITHDVQRSRSTRDWVQEYRKPLEELARVVRVMTLLRLRMYESVVATLLGLPGDSNMMNMLLTALDALPPDALLEKHRVMLVDHLTMAMRFLATTYTQFPSPSFYTLEGAFLMKLLDDEGIEAIRDREHNNTTLGDRTASLAFVWLRLCSYSRCLEAQQTEIKSE